MGKSADARRWLALARKKELIVGGGRLGGWWVSHHDRTGGSGRVPGRRAGRGDDTMDVLYGCLPVNRWGGTGDDKLKLDGMGDARPGTTPPTNRIQNIERFDLTGTGGQHADISGSMPINLSDTSNTLSQRQYRRPTPISTAVDGTSSAESKWGRHQHDRGEVYQLIMQARADN